MQQPQVPRGGRCSVGRGGGCCTFPGGGGGAGGRLTPHPCLGGLFRPAFGGRACVGANLQATMCNRQVGLLPGQGEGGPLAALGPEEPEGQGGCNLWFTQCVLRVKVVLLIPALGPLCILQDGPTTESSRPEVSPSLPGCHCRAGLPVSALRTTLLPGSQVHYRQSMGSSSSYKFR